MSKETVRSSFAQALASLIDQTDLFNRDEWAYLVGVSRETLEEWPEDKSVPRPDQLFMIICTLQQASFIPREPLAAFEKMANRPSLEISPHGALMLPTVNEYIIRPTFSRLNV